MKNRQKVTKIICLVLAFLMIAGAAAIVFSVLGSLGAEVAHSH